MEFKFMFGPLSKGYICNPFTPAKSQMVTIEKESGVRRLRSDDKIEQALLNYLTNAGLKLEDYYRIVKEAQQEWIKNDEGHIIIPQLQIEAAMRESSKKIPKAMKIDGNWIGSIIQVSDFVTPRKECDKKFARMVKIKDAKGIPLSNEPRETVNEVIREFEAVGTVIFDTNDVKLGTVLDFLMYVGKYNGVGSARGLGFGRFVVSSPSRPENEERKQGSRVLKSKLRIDKKTEVAEPSDASAET
jgi:hypothetical protein